MELADDVLEGAKPGVMAFTSRGVGFPDAVLAPKTPALNSCVPWCFTRRRPEATPGKSRRPL